MTNHVITAPDISDYWDARCRALLDKEHIFRPDERLRATHELYTTIEKTCESECSINKEYIPEPFLGSLRNQTQQGFVVLGYNPGSPEDIQRLNQTSKFGQIIWNESYSTWAGDWPYFDPKKCDNVGLNNWRFRLMEVFFRCREIALSPEHERYKKPAESALKAFSAASLDGVVAMEMFPWHSDEFPCAGAVARKVTDELIAVVLHPIQSLCGDETDTKLVFVFGSSWLSVLQKAKQDTGRWEEVSGFQKTSWWWHMGVWAVKGDAR